MDKISEVLPNLFYAGIGKAASSSMCKWLEQHPDIYFGSRKEPLFFGWSYHKGMEVYRSLYQGYEGQKVVVDASVWSLGHEDVPLQVKKECGDIKVLFLLRNPVHRAYSQYWHELEGGKINYSQSFLDVLYNDNLYIRHFSMYGKNIGTWYSQFGRSNILLLKYEDMKHDPAGMLKQIFNFIEVDDGIDVDIRGSEMLGKSPRFPLLFRVIQERKMRKIGCVISWIIRLNWRMTSLFFVVNPASRPVLCETEYSEAMEYFKKDIEKVMKISGVDLSEWLAIR